MYRRYAILLIGVFVFFGGVVPVFADARSIFEEAQRRFDNGTYELAIERFRALRREYPNSEFVLRGNLRIGQGLFYLGEFEEAQEELAWVRVRAQRGSGLQQETLFWSGLTHFQLQEFDETVRLLSLYIDADGTQTGRAYLYRGVAQLELGNDPEGRTDLAEARNDLAGPERGYAVAKLLSSLDQIGDDDTIIEIFTNETEARSFPEAYRESVYRLAADALYRDGQMQRARETYTTLTEFSSESAQWAYQRLYEIAQAAGDRPAMDAVFRRAEERLASEPERLRAFWLALGEDAVDSERYELAELYLSRLWSLRESGNVPATTALLLATSLEMQNRSSEAISILQASFSEPLAQDGSRFDRSLSLARLLYEANRFEEAIATTEEIEGFESRAPSLYLWGISSYQAGRVSTVVEKLGTPQAEVLGRDIPEITHLYARAFLDTNSPREAVPIYRLYLAERPDDINARVELIRALVSATEFSAALQEIDRIDRSALDQRRSNEVQYLTGLSRFHRRNYRAALQAFAQVDDLQYEPVLSYHIAWSLYRTGDIPEAGRRIASIRDALPLDLAIDGSYLYGWTLYQQGRFDSATDVLLPLIGSAPSPEQTVEIRRLLAAVYLSQGADDDAIAQYRAILTESRPATRAENWNRYAGVLAAVGRDEAAVAEYDDISERYVDLRVGEEALLEAGQILATTGQYTAARDRFRTYRNRFPEGSSIDRALYWGGQASYELDEAERAILWWEPLVREYPRSSYTPRALFQSAVIHAERNRRREALELFDRYVAAYPEGGDASEAERRRQELRLEQSGLTALEARLWAELEPASGNAPTVGGERWFDLVLELAQMAIREQITLTFERGRIVPKLMEAADFPGDNGAEAHILLAEYYDRRQETRRALEQYVEAASTDGASDELRAQSLFRLAELANAEGDAQTSSEAVRELTERYPETIWADQAGRLIGDDQ